MEYNELQAFLAKIMPKAEVKLATEFAQDWMGVAVKIGERVAVAYKASDINGPGEQGWLIDHFSVAENDPMAFVPDVWDLGDEAKVVQHLTSWYINRA